MGQSFGTAVLVVGGTNTASLLNVLDKARAGLIGGLPAGRCASARRGRPAVALVLTTLRAARTGLGTLATWSHGHEGLHPRVRRALMDGGLVPRKNAEISRWIVIAESMSAFFEAASPSDFLLVRLRKSWRVEPERSAPPAHADAREAGDLFAAGLGLGRQERSVPRRTGTR